MSEENKAAGAVEEQTQGGWFGNILGVLDEVATGVIETFEGLDALGDKVGEISGSVGGDNKPEKQTSAPPVYEANIKFSDFAFKPNMYMFGFGVALLVVAFVLSRRS